MAFLNEFQTADENSPANGYAHNEAHEALADVRATIHIARLVRERAPNVWQAMLQNAGKQSAIDRITSTPEFSWTERWGRNFLFLSTACGINPNNSGQIGVFDLAYDPLEVFDLTVEELVGLLNSNEKLIRVISANKQPMIFPAEMARRTPRP